MVYCPVMAALAAPDPLQVAIAIEVTTAVCGMRVLHLANIPVNVLTIESWTPNPFAMPKNMKNTAITLTPVCEYVPNKPNEISTEEDVITLVQETPG